MTTSTRSRAGIFLALALVVVAGAGGYAYYRYLHRDEPPSLPLPDIGNDQSAGHVTREGGAAYMRPVVPADLATIHVSPLPAGAAPGWKPIQDKSALYLGTLIRVGNKGYVQTSSQGNWLVSIEQDSEAVFQDARVDAKRSVVVDYWFVKKGTFRAKPNEYDPIDHWMLIQTPAAKIYLHKGEIGMNLDEGGRGTVWLMSGSGILVTPDGKHRPLSFRGIDYI